MKTTLFVIRHGQSTANTQNLFAGHHDYPLTELGHTQARLTADYLKDTHIDVVYASDLSRAQDTAAPIAAQRGLAVVVDPDLREMCLGELEGIPAPELYANNPEFMQTWRHDFASVRCPGGESTAELVARAAAVLDKLARANAGKVVCIATHGGMLRAMRCVWDGADLATMNDTPWASNASVSCVEWEDGVYTLLAYSHDAHLGDLCTTVWSAKTDAEASKECK